MLDNIAAAASKLLRKEAISIVLEAMNSVCTVYDVNFRDFLETQEDVEGELLEEKVHFVLTNPHYCVTYERDLDHSSHNFFTPVDMSEFVELW